MLTVTDSWVKWLWQDTEAWRIRFRVAPKSVPVPICQLKNRSSDNQSQLTHSQPYKGLLERGKAQSNTNKHEDQQMALSVIVFFSVFKSNARGPCSLSFLTYPDKYLSFQILLRPPWFPLGGSAVNVTCSSVRCSPHPHTAVIRVTPCYFTPTIIGGVMNESAIYGFRIWRYW